MGLSAIPIQDYMGYYDIFGGPHSLDSFARIMRAIDGAYLEAAHKAQQKQSKRKHA